jgi:hypothetical protein
MTSLNVGNYTQRIQASYVEKGLADLDVLQQKGIHPFEKSCRKPDVQKLLSAITHQ